jgi:hypothetical protein
LKKTLVYTFLLVLIQGTLFHHAFSQKSAEEELKDANKLFEDGKYKEAAPLFLKKLSVDQKSAEFNFKYGTCILYSDGNKKEGLKYLRFASSMSNVDSRVWFHLGKAYHLNYMFSDAVKSYQKFIQLNPKDQEKYNVQLEIDACNYGKKLLKTITEVQVVSRKEFTTKDFFYAYKLQGIGGEMALINGLRSDLDKKKEHDIIVYFPSKKSINSTIFYSSYGKDGKNGKDIYKVNRLPDGTFGQPQIVNGPVNTSFDEDFPYMHPDGRTFYFASKGHNSMGGYDIFRCYYDEDNNTFSKPENVDFAINTPGDDMLFVTDSLEKMAFFASTRESATGKINVYNVLVDRLPINIAILKGNFINEINESYLSASITIEDVATGEVVGIYNTNRNTGSYLITLPKGGKYKFSVMGESQKVHVGLVDIPPMKELKPLKQELVLTKEENVEVLKIRNLFDEEFENVDEILAEVFLGKSKLDPNIDPDDTSALSGDGTSDNLDIKADEDVLAVAKKDADQLQQDYETAKIKMEGAYAFALKKQNEAKEKSDKANDLLIEASKVTDVNEKEQLLQAANDLNEEAAKDNALAVSGFNLAKGMETDVAKKKKDADVAKEFEKGIEQAVNAKNHKEVISELEKQKEFIKNVQENNGESRDNETALRNEASEKKKEVDKTKNRLDDLYENESDLKSDIAKLKQEYENPNTKKDRKKEIETLLREKETELSDTQAQIAANDKKYKQLIAEQMELDQQLAVMTGISDGAVISQAEKDKLAQEISNNNVNETIEKNKTQINSGQNENRTDREKTQDFLAENSQYDELTKRKNEASKNPDKKTGLTEEKKINDQIIQELEKANTELEKKYSSETDPEKKKEIASQIEEVKKMKEETVADNQKIEKDIAAVNTTTNDVTNENTEIVLTDDRKKELTNSTLPGYNEQVNAINNSTDPQKEKLADKVDLNDNVIKNADNRISQIDKVLPNLTGDDRKKLEKEKSELEQLKKKLEEENESHEKEIAKIEQDEKNAAATNNTNDTKNNFTTENKDQINEVDPGYETKINEIKNSGKSDTRMEYETKKANEELLTQIEEKENKIKTDNTISESDKKKQLDDLNTLKEKTENEINEGDRKLAENGVKTNKVENTEVNATDYTDVNALKNVATIEKKSDAIEKREENLDNLYVESAETSDPDKKKEIDKKIASEEKSLYNDVNNLAPELEKANTAEYSKTDAAVEKTKKDILRNGNPDETNSTYKQAQEEESRAEQDKKDADYLRNQAKLEKDPGKKAELNAEAAEKEKSAIEHSREANRLYDAYKNEMPVATNAGVQNMSEEKKETVNSVDPDYIKEMAAIENSGDSPEEKNIRKNEAQEDLIKNIEKEELKVKTDFSSTEEEKNKKLKELNELKNDTKREMEKSDEELKEAGLSDPRNSDVKYESLSFNSTESNKQIEDVKKDLAALDKMKEEANEARKDFVTIEDEKLKKLAKTDLDKKDKNIANKEIAVADDLKAANDADWKEVQSEYQQKKETSSGSFNANDERKTTADQLASEAENDRKEAEQLRLEASKEKDVLVKADKLRNAYELEKNANEKMKVASDLLDQSMANSLASKVTTENKDGKGNTIVPENKDERNSTQIRKLAADELRKADSLNNAAADYEKQAQSGNKKSKEENKKKADDLRKEAETHQGISNGLYAKANEEEKKEEKLFTEQVKRNEEEKIREEKKEEVKTMPEYVQYYDLKKRADDKKAAADKVKADAENQQSIADNTRKEAEDTRTLASNESDVSRKDQLSKTANDLDKKANQAERKADSLNRVAEKMYVESSGFNWDVEQYLKKIDSKKSEDILLATSDGKLPEPDKSLTVATDPTKKDFIPPTVVTQDVFVKTETAVYNENNPIPIDPKLPSGPFLKVQVGAFRNPINPAIYKNFAPVTGESKGDGITRYTVGYFTNLESAIKARDEIRAMGYKDAFVVGFEDGKRTSVDNALAKLNGTNSEVAVTNTNSTNTTNTTNNINTANSANTTNNTNTSNPSNEELVKNFTADEKKDDYYTAVPNAAKANQIEVIKGLFYTVQVGVYSKPVTPDKIFNLSPLNSELITRNNWIRYTTGIFTNFAKADSRKDEIRTIGVKDAFVVAYINGNKITPEKANELLKQYGDTILVKTDAAGNPVKGTSSLNSSTNTNTNASTNTNNANTNANTSTNTTNTSNSNPNQKYTIILGEYGEEVPNKDAEIFIRHPNDGIKRKTENGKTVFYLDGITGKEKAEKTLQQYKEEGLTNARIDDGTATSNNSGSNPNSGEKPKLLKQVNGLVFQVYLGEYVSDLPDYVTAIILNNMSKGIKRKETGTGSTIYFTGDFTSYDEAMKDKAYFFIEGITDVKIIPLHNTKEISVTEALNLMYE